MTFSLFNKNRCSITDELFLELTWEDGRGLEDDSELLDIIEGLDHLANFPQPISKSLPYLTFQQAELLFKELKQAYGKFQLKKVSIAHLEGKSAVTEGEVYASPFLITEDYENLLFPLIQAILTRSEFASYSYQEKREYFENQIYPVYKQSLGLSDSSVPLFPAEGETLIGSKCKESNRCYGSRISKAVIFPQEILSIFRFCWSDYNSKYRLCIFCFHSTI